LQLQRADKSRLREDSIVGETDWFPGGEPYRGNMIAPVAGDAAKSCEVVTDFARLEQLSADWLRLWNASPRREIFQDFGWIRAFWRFMPHSRTGREPPGNAHPSAAEGKSSTSCA